MTVTTIASIAATLSRASSNPSSKASALFSGLFPTNNAAANTAKTDTANFSATISLQNQVAQLRIASQNVAQTTSLLAAAEQGASTITQDLGRLKDVATRASAANVSEQERASLSSEFTVIRSRIDRTARSTKFNNEKLLDGSSAQLKIAQDAKATKNLSIGSLTDDVLFKGAATNIGTPAAAKATEELVKQALAYANTQLDNIHALQAGLDLAASTLESAIQNQDASRSTLSEGDFTTQLLGGTSPLVGNDISSLFAQTNRLPPSMLQLLSE